MSGELLNWFELVSSPDCRYILLPQMIISSLLLLTRGVSHFTAQFTNQASSSLIMSDVFILTTIEKLIAVGYNAHLIIFFTTRRSGDS